MAPRQDGPYEHRGTRAVQRMVEYAPSTGSLALWIRHVDAEQDPQVVASNDGLTIRYAPEFERLSLARQTGLVAHQVLHVALRHAPRFIALRRQQGDVDLELFNICADAIVNSTLRHLSWLELHPKAVLLEDLLLKTLGIETEPSAALLAWDLERLYRAIDDRRMTTTSRAGRQQNKDRNEGGSSSRQDEDSARGAKRLTDGVRAARVRAIGRHDSHDLVPNAEADLPENEIIAAREWRERLLRGHASDGGHSMLRALLADLPVPKTPWEQVLRSKLNRGLSQQRALAWSRPSRSYVANQGRMRNGKRMPWEPGWSSHKAVARLAVMLDVSGSIDSTLLQRFAAELSAITRRQEASAVVIVGDDRVREVRVFEPGLTDLDGIACQGGGGTDFAPLLAEASNWSPDIGIFLTDLDGPAAYRPVFPVVWAVPQANAHLDIPFGTKLVLD